MANRDTPNGFQPVAMVDGSDVPVRRFPVDADEASTLMIGDLVAAEADGNVNLAVANDGIVVLGAVTAIYDTNGVPAGHPNSAISTKYKPNSTAALVDVALALPSALFKCQSDTDTVIAEGVRFATANHVEGTGDTTTAVSRGELDSSDIAGGTGLQFRIIDKVDEPNNNWGENHVDLLVSFNESMFSAAAANTTIN